MLFRPLFPVVAFFSFYTPGLLLTSFFFFFNDTATTEIYTLSLHDALPIYEGATYSINVPFMPVFNNLVMFNQSIAQNSRSEEHTSELQSLAYLVCRLLLEKKKTKTTGAGDGEKNESARASTTRSCLCSRIR